MARGIGWFGKVRVLRQRILPAMREAAQEGLQLGSRDDMVILRKRFLAPVIHLQRADSDACPACGKGMEHHQLIAYDVGRHGSVAYQQCPGGRVTRVYVPGVSRRYVQRIRWLHGGPEVS